MTDQSENKEVVVDEVKRNFTGKMQFVIAAIALAWALFQLWYASPLSLISSNIARPIHLAFAIVLAFAIYPLRKNHQLNSIPWFDYVFAILGVSASLYLVVFNDALALRPGDPVLLDLIFAGIGLLLLLEATRRSLGPPLVIIALVFLFYSLFANYFPDVLSRSSVSLPKLLTHQWLTSEGVFGVAIGVSASFVFLFVLFGALLEKAGAGNYFIQVAFSLLGHLRGGPAKASVVASALSGLISGSSIANVVTTGTFTIPLMKRVGFSPAKAGAVEVAASTNGQITPPIMGAAAFLMVEYVGIPYIKVIQYAILPSLIAYIALLYIVHLEALKANMQGLQRTGAKKSWIVKLFIWTSIILGLSIFSLAIYYFLEWLKPILGEAFIYSVLIGLFVSYIFLVWYSCQFPELKIDNPEEELEHLPEVAPTVKSGLYFLLPVAVLVWCLTVEKLSPGLSAFWASLFMIFILITQKPLIAFFRKRNEQKKLSSDEFVQETKSGFLDLISGLITGSQNMIGIGIATAAAGIIVGTVTLTGIGLVMTEFVELISGGNLLLILIFTAVISLILGMGLPTTANYIVVSTLMAPVIVTLGAEQGLIVPLIAVHLFVFYFGILADVTPPVGLAAFAASAIAKSDPIKTGLQAFYYSIRTAILPFMFIFNTDLLLLDIDSIFHLVTVVIGALVAMLIFAAATQNFWLVKNKWWETLLLLLLAFVLFRPGFIWDRIYPPLQTIVASDIFKVVDKIPATGSLRLQVSGQTIDGEDVSKIVVLPLLEKSDYETSEARLAASGLHLIIDAKQVEVEYVDFDSEAQKLGLDFGWQINAIERETERLPKEIMMLPAFLILFLLYLNQRKRRAKLQLSQTNPKKASAT